MPYSEAIYFDSERKVLQVGEFGLDFNLIKAVYFAMIPIEHPEVDLELEIARYNK